MFVLYSKALISASGLRFSEVVNYDVIVLPVPPTVPEHVPDVALPKNMPLDMVALPLGGTKSQKNMHAPVAVPEVVIYLYRILFSPFVPFRVGMVDIDPAVSRVMLVGIFIIEVESENIAVVVGYALLSAKYASATFCTVLALIAALESRARFWTPL